MTRENYLQIRNQLDFNRYTRYIFMHVAQDAAILLCAFHASRQAAIGQVVAAALLAGFMFRSFSFMHDAVHGALHNRRSINGWLGHVYGAFSFLPFSQWKAIHVAHHTWAGNLDLDPTMKIIKDFRDTGHHPSTAQEFAWRWWLPYLSFRQQIVFWKKSLEDRSQFKIVAVELALMAIFVATCVWSLGWIVALGAIGLNLYLIELVNFPHHLGLEQGGGLHKLVPMDQYEVARSVVYARWFSRLVLLNFNYHVEHHLYPTLPWHQLDAAHELVKVSLGEKFNLLYGNGWLKESRRLTFQQVLEQSTGRSADDLQETKLVA